MSLQKVFLWCRSSSDQAFFRAYATLTFILLMVIAWRSGGHLHPDEYFQQLAFADYKRGGTPADSLPWEFREAIRPWFQPGVIYLIMKGMQNLGFENPYDWVRAIRLSHAFLGWVACLAFGKMVLIWVKTFWLQRLTLIFHGLFFMTAFVHARTSSENLSTSLLVVAIYALLNRWFALTGILLGLMFHSRYQTAFAGLGMVMWLVVMSRNSARNVSSVILCGLVTVAFGLLIDYWGYGFFTITPWNYFKTNLIDGVAANFGVSPWYDYPSIVNRLYLFPFGSLLFYGGLIAWVLAPRHILVWTLLPFLVVHIMIGHKEPRFVFAYLYLSPLLMAVALERRLSWLEKLRTWAIRHRRISSAFLILIFVFNLRGHAMLNVVPVQPQIAGMEILWSRYKQPFHFYYTGLQPFRASSLNMHLYAPPSFDFSMVYEIADASELKVHQEPVVYYRERRAGTGTAPDVTNCTLIWSNASEWMNRFASDSNYAFIFYGLKIREFFACGMTSTIEPNHF